MKNDCFYVDVMSVSPEVTGSCIYVTIKYPDHTFQHFIVDCGIFQEPSYDSLNSELLFDPTGIDFALLTHNHIDHTARFPFIVMNGFNSPIYTTEDTSVLLPYALNDTASILQNRSRSKKVNSSLMYNETNVNDTLKLVKPCAYNETINIGDNIKITFFKNGHLIGAALILVQISYYQYDTINLLFTGDYNNKNVFFDVPSLPQWVLDLPINIICESTYGEVDTNDIQPCFEKNLVDFFNVNDNKTVICPVFSLGRSQEILKFLMNMQNAGELNNIPIFLDGKLTQSYTKLFIEHKLNSIDIDKSKFMPQNVTYVYRDSRPEILQDVDTRKIIVSSSGMGSYGPAETYLQHYLKDSNTLVHFTGYAAEGTLSRKLVESKSNSVITFGGLVIPKKAVVKSTAEFSAHAKANELVNFLESFKNILTVLVTHGAKDTKDAFAQRVINEVNSKDVGILSRDYFFRIKPYGLVKTIPSKFTIF